MSTTPLLGETIGENLRRTKDRCPSHDALIVRAQGYRATYQELWDQTTDIALGLLAFGVEIFVEGKFVELAHDINFHSARQCRICADRAAAQTRRRRYVAGALGPTPRTASISPDVNDPGYRNVSFDELVRAYTDALRGLLDGPDRVVGVFSRPDAPKGRGLETAARIVSTRSATSACKSGVSRSRTGCATATACAPRWWRRQPARASR